MGKIISIILIVCIYFVLNCFITFATENKSGNNIFINKVVNISLKNVMEKPYTNTLSLRLKIVKHINLKSTNQSMEYKACTEHLLQYDNATCNPNPAVEFVNFQIESSVETIAVLKIFSFKMLEVYQTQICLKPFRNEIKINLSDFCSGLYSYSITYDNKIAHGTFVILK